MRFVLFGLMCIALVGCSSDPIPKHQNQDRVRVLEPFYEGETGTITGYDIIKEYGESGKTVKYHVKFDGKDSSWDNIEEDNLEVISRAVVVKKDDEVYRKANRPSKEAEAN